MIQRQRGATFLGIVVILAILGVAVYAGIRLVPVYLDYMKIARSLEQVKEAPGAHGIFNMSAGDHLGLDQRARVMVKIENGAWKYAP